MKYPTHVYARALALVIGETQERASAAREKLAENFVELVRRNGDEIHLRKILEEAARFTRGENSVRKVTLRSARPLTTAQREILKDFVRAGDVVEEEIDPELIAGVKIVIDDETQFDESLKGKLDRLFGTA